MSKVIRCQQSEHWCLQVRFHRLQMRIQDNNSRVFFSNFEGSFDYLAWYCQSTTNISELNQFTRTIAIDQSGLGIQSLPTLCLAIALAFWELCISKSFPSVPICPWKQRPQSFLIELSSGQSIFILEVDSCCLFTLVVNSTLLLWI